MATEAQIDANKRNAESSTGSKTARCKAAVARNALRRGLRAEKVLTFDETGADFQSFLHEQRAALAPADGTEEQLVERIAMLAWRLRRTYRVEAELIDGWRNASPRRLEDLEIGAVFECSPGEMTRLARYETGLDRSLHRAYVMLERRQARRRGEAVPAPIAVEITGEIAGLAAIETQERLRAQSENFRTKPILPIESESDIDHASVPAH